jgi:hypothetical protein
VSELSEAPAPTGWRVRAASLEVAALAGIVCAIGWTISLRGLLGRPAISASREEIARFYASTGSESQLRFLLGSMVIATIGFLWFVGVVRSRLGDRETTLVGSVFFGGSLLLTALVLAGAAALAAPSLLVHVGKQVPDPGATSMSRAVAAVVLSMFAPRVATLVILSAASLCRSSHAVPMWVIVVSYILGIAAFVDVTVSEPALIIFPAWMVMISVVLLIRRSAVAAPS